MRARQSYENVFLIAMATLKRLFFIILSFTGLCAHAETLRVGPNLALKAPSDAAEIAKDGDVIEIETGSYPDDSTIWRAGNLTIRGVGEGRVQLPAGRELAQDKAIWVIKGDDTTVENVEFSGAAVEDRNGAGIRQEGAGLIVRNCYFHHNENGILTNSNPQSDILIEYSEFFANGHGDGYSHNIYIGEVNSFTLQFSFSHGADVGHQVKSRAHTNRILYNRLMDEDDGTSSYIIDLPNGGLSVVVGNVIQQGPETDNSTLVSYGAEGSLHDDSKLYIANNTFVNDRHAGVFIKIVPDLDGNFVINNLFAGRGKLIGTANFIANVETTDPEFVSPENYDYHLRKNSPAIDAGKDIGKLGSIDLTPTQQYVHPLQSQPRVVQNRLDAGAYEYTH